MRIGWLQTNGPHIKDTKQKFITKVMSWCAMLSLRVGFLLLKEAKKNETKVEGGISCGLWSGFLFSTFFCCFFYEFFLKLRRRKGLTRFFYHKYMSLHNLVNSNLRKHIELCFCQKKKNTLNCALLHFRRIAGWSPRHEEFPICICMKLGRSNRWATY